MLYSLYEEMRSGYVVCFLHTNVFTIWDNWHNHVDNHVVMSCGFKFESLMLKTQTWKRYYALLVAKNVHHQNWSWV